MTSRGRSPICNVLIRSAFLVPFQGRLLAGAAGGEQGQPRHPVRHQGDRQEGPQGQGGLPRERDQSPQKVSRGGRQQRCRRGLIDEQDFPANSRNRLRVLHLVIGWITQML